MADRKSDFALPTLDDLFSTQEERDEARLWNTTPSICATVQSVTADRKCKTYFFDFPLSHTLTPKTTCTIRKERYNTIS